MSGIVKEWDGDFQFDRDDHDDSDDNQALFRSSLEDFSGLASKEEKIEDTILI